MPVKTLPRFLRPDALLVPHALSLAAFLAAFAVIAIADTNRLLVDLWLGIAGYVLGLLGVAATLLAVVIVIVDAAARPAWPWLLVHLAALGLVVWAAVWWLALHMA